MMIDEDVFVVVVVVVVVEKKKKENRNKNKRNLLLQQQYQIWVKRQFLIHQDQSLQLQLESLELKKKLQYLISSSLSTLFHHLYCHHNHPDLCRHKLLLI